MENDHPERPAANPMASGAIREAESARVATLEEGHGRPLAPADLADEETSQLVVAGDGDLNEAARRHHATLGQNLLAGLLGVGVAFFCFVPPILHFITGPLAPGIGGFVAGTRTGASGEDAWIIGGTIGFGLAIMLGVAAFIISGIVGGRPLAGMSAIVSGGALVYGTLLGTLGAHFGGRMDRAK